MKKILSLVLLLGLLVSMLAGCASSASTTTAAPAATTTAAAAGETTAAAANTFKVAYIARAQADSFAAWLANGVIEEAKKYPNIQLEVFDGQASDEKQNSLIENAITNKFDLIIVQPNNGEAQRPYVEKIVKAGIFAITTNARISGIEGASSVDADPYAQAAVGAQRALTEIPQNANVVVLKGPPGNFHADERRLSWEKEFFEKRSDVKIVGENIANWNKDEAMKLMEDWVQANDKIDAIISMNDNMAAGAIEVIKDNSKFANILSYGVDGTAEACLLIKDGKMTATTLQNAYDLATLLLKTSNDLLTGAQKQVDTDIGNPLITKENVDQYIDMYKKTGAIK